MMDKELLKAAAEQIQLLEAEIARLLAPPFGIGMVLGGVGDTRLLLSGDQIVNLPAGKKVKDYPPGTMVIITGSKAIVEAMEVPLAGGETTVKRVFEGDQMEVDGGIGAMLVFKGLVANCVKAGDLVQLDRTGSVALRVIPKDTSRHSVETATGVSWADVGGCHEAKQALQEAVEGPIKHAKWYKVYGKKPLKGALLSGPPGCGKTMLAKACANAIRELHGAKEATTGFIYVKGPELLNMWVGNSEAQIRGLFTRAREHFLEHNYPAVLFIDEADAILGKRGERHGTVLSSTIVPQFLSEMDGLVDSGAFVLLATNRPDTLDPAIVREGRVDRKVAVSRPTLKESAQILRIHLKKTKVVEDIDTLAGVTASNIFSDDHLLYRVGLKGKAAQNFYIRHLVSGAMLAGVVDMGTSIAIKRDAEAGKASGLSTEDLTEAVTKIVQSNKGLNHEDDLQTFAEQHGTQVEAVQRMAA